MNLITIACFPAITTTYDLPQVYEYQFTMTLAYSQIFHMPSFLDTAKFLLRVWISKIFSLVLSYGKC